MALTIGRLRLTINSIAIDPDPDARRRRIDSLYREVLLAVIAGHPQSRELAAEMLRAQTRKFERNGNDRQDQRHLQEGRASA